MRFKSEAEIKKTISRRMKRNKKQGTEQPIELTIAEKLPVFETIRCNAKVRSFDFAASGPLKVLVALCNNSFEVYQVDTDESTPSSRQLSVVDIGGHRSDVRTVALSSDDELLMTASSEMVKVWSVQSTQCLHSMDAGYALCSAFLPKNRHVVIGTKTGHLEVYDLASSSLIESIQAHDGPIWSLQVKPDKTGLVAGSQDKSVKFFDFRSIIDESYSKITPRISLYHTRTLKLTDDVLAVKVSPDGKLLAVSLLDLTVKIFYTDSLKFFISLYGHKLPVICLDISFDSKLIITGSSDKSIKIWGLDFGDCHKSILAHQDSVMCVQFVWGTYFFFSTGKDGVLTYWDAEKFERLSKLQGHQGSIWALCVGKYGNLVVTASHDKSIRVWEKTDEQVLFQLI